MCEKLKTKTGTQVGAQIKEDDSGDGDSHHGEKWMKKPLIYSKVLGWSGKWRILKYYWPKYISNSMKYYIIFLER